MIMRAGFFRFCHLITFPALTKFMQVPTDLRKFVGLETKAGICE